MRFECGGRFGKGRKKQAHSGSGMKGEREERREMENDVYRGTDGEIFRRFVQIGTEEEMDRFRSLAEEKNLSREDLAVILRAVRLNPNICW